MLATKSSAGQDEDTRKMLQEIIWKQKWENYRQKHVDGPPAIRRDLEDEKPAPEKRDHNSYPG